MDNHLSENTVNDNSKNDSKSNVSSRIMNSLINIIFSTQDTKDLSDKDIESDYSDYDSSNVDLCTHWASIIEYFNLFFISKYSFQLLSGLKWAYKSKNSIDAQYVFK